MHVADLPIGEVDSPDTRHELVDRTSSDWGWPVMRLRWLTGESYPGECGGREFGR
jgi:hypothetical protein